MAKLDWMKLGRSRAGAAVRETEGRGELAVTKEQRKLMKSLARETGTDLPDVNTMSRADAQAIIGYMIGIRTDREKGIKR